MEDTREIAVGNTCFHCGDEVKIGPINLDNHTFCCLGCQTVYQILKESNLQSYYKYNVHPGKSQKGSKSSLSYLDEEGVVEKLVDFKDEQISIITFYIPEIHCSSCIWLLENVYKLDSAITRSRVDFLKKQGSFTFKHDEISLRGLVELLTSIGYEPKVTLQDVIKENKSKTDKNLIAKIGVAGFCFGNSMMLSFPEYFGLEVYESEYAEVFGYMNLSFSIPVLLYCASDYFRSAILSLKQFKLNIDVPLALGVLVIFLRTFIEVVTATGPGFADTLCSLVFFILIGKWIQQRTYYHISFERDYRSYFPVAVTKICEKGESPVQIADLQVGDRILIRNNEIIPADSILLKGEATVDFSFVTGESTPLEKILGEVIYAGGRQTGSAIELEVVKTVSQSYLTQLWNNDSLKNGDRKFDTFVGFISQYFTVGLITVALSAALFWLCSGDVTKAWSAFTAVLIIGCPCALALSTPFTLSAVLSIFDKHKFYVKSTAVVEELATINCLVFDKTGTISSPKSSTMFFSGELNTHERQLAASVCRMSSHPLSRQIVEWLGVNSFYAVDCFEEFPGRGIVATIDKQVVKVGSAMFVKRELPEVDGTLVCIAIDDQYMGNCRFEQKWRYGVDEVFREFRDGYDMHLLSGDNERLRSELNFFFSDSSVLLFNQSPSEKLNRIERWQGEGNHVCMLGDGLNDAGALRQADIGIAVSDDINNFSPGCDAILDGESFTKLPQFFQFAKDGVKVIHISFVISLIYNVLGLSIAVQGTMSPLFAAILMPISTVTIISFTSIATRWFARFRKL